LPKVEAELSITLIALILCLDDGYYEDMYPEYEDPDPEAYHPETEIALDLMREEELIDPMTPEAELEGEEPLTPITMKPITPQTYTNLVFEVGTCKTRCFIWCLR
jgi:hypothetical protein